MAEWVTYLGLGAFAGLLAGLLGVGGGLVIVPVLAAIFVANGFDPATLMHLAIGTSLATIVMTSIASVRAHHRHGAVLWSTFWRLTPGIVVGALLGALVADWLPGDRLRFIFGLFELLVALQMGLNLKPAPHRGLPGQLGMSVTGGVIGAVSAVVGIGGGTMTVPFLAWCHVGLRQAVATSAACGLPIAIAGAAGFLLSGWGGTGLPPGSSGYLYWPAFAAIVTASMLFAPLGAHLTHTLPLGVIKRLFALLLLLLALYMLSGV